MMENIFKILFVLGFVATIVAVVAVAFALAVPMKEIGPRRDRSQAAHLR